jgi:hypothetical protein
VYVERGRIDYQVKKEWEGSAFEGKPGECDDPYYRLAFRGIDPLDAAFEHNARVVFGRMHEVLEEEPLT